ncbi:MAG: head GIN domain-containing protein [Bacteroidota bacterium]|nr:head GIN domain-containing protein [Bacteroidota bacterium]
MKKLLVGIFALLSLNSFAQPWQTITGDGHVKKENREVSEFTSLASGGSMDIQIAYGNSNTITVEADKNLLPYIETSVEDGRLSIKSKKNVNLKTRSKIVVNVSMTKISSLQQSGSGNINGKGEFTNEGETTISTSGSGNIDLTFGTFKNLALNISGSGNMNLKGGATNNIDAKISGSGNIDCLNISSNDVNVKIAGSGNIKVFAQNSIDAKISGSGNVFYKGNATNIKSKVAGSGKVRKI